MSARQDNNFLEMIRALPMRGATPRWVTVTEADIRRVKHRAARRKAGLPAAIRDAGVVSKVAGLIRAK